jgi:hypothetical protein
MTLARHQHRFDIWYWPLYFARVSRTDVRTRRTTPTGDVHLTRICEMRQLENSLGFQSDFGLLSDDKALRYTSKAAALLGM